VIYQLLEQEITFTEGIHAHAQYVYLTCPLLLITVQPNESSSTIQTFYNKPYVAMNSGLIGLAL